MIRPYSELLPLLRQNKIESCFVDTSTLFSATYPLDPFNDESENIFNGLSETGVPAFSNVNVRTEFLENHRRVLIAECLIDFLENFEVEIDGFILEKLKAHRTSYRNKVREDRSTKLDINQIRAFRKLLNSYKFSKGTGWEVFCRSYLSGKLETLWVETQRVFELHFISLRSTDSSPYLNELPKWERAMQIMGLYGIGSSDAMILNMFFCSKIPVLLTADLEMADCADKESKGTKEIFVPDSALKL